MRVTEAAGHGAALAREFVARGFDIVAAWGGDGTVNEVAGALIGAPAALAIVRSGSGDGLARGLGLPSDPAAAIGAALSGATRAIDVGFLGSRHFLNIAGIGFDARVAETFARKGRYGSLSYATRALQALWSYSPSEYALSIAGTRLEGRRFLVAFANSRQYGNGLVISPDADPSDGLLNAIVVDDGSALRQLWRARRLFVNRLGPAEGVRRLRVQSASVTGGFLRCHVDGEPFEARGTIEVTVRPGALRVAGTPTNVLQSTAPDGRYAPVIWRV